MTGWTGPYDDVEWLRAKQPYRCYWCELGVRHQWHNQGDHSENLAELMKPEWINGQWEPNPLMGYNAVNPPKDPNDRTPGMARKDRHGRPATSVRGRLP